MASKQVSVKLLFDLERYAPREEGPFRVVLEGSATFGNLMDKLKIPFSPEMVALVDGRPVDPAAVLPEKSRVTVFPILIGG
jgi:hypothetical protein